MKIRYDIVAEWVSSYFVQLHGPIHNEKIGCKYNSDVIKIVNKYVQYLIIWKINRQLC